jgi:hypothetical protein
MLDPLGHQVGPNQLNLFQELRVARRVDRRIYPLDCCSIWPCDRSRS